MNTAVRHFVAEFVGTFALVFVGSGAILMAARTNTPAGLVGIALAHGVILAVMVSAGMSVSGAHYNPSVTVAIWITRRIPAVMAGIHVLAQVIGGIVAALSLKALVSPELFAAARGGGQWIASDVTFLHAVILEAIATFFLVFVVFGTCVNPDGPKLGGMAIGLTIAADILAIGPLTGGSMNPARSFGPALAVGNWEGQMVFWVGPIIGAVLAALVWEYVFFRGAARQH